MRLPEKFFNDAFEEERSSKRLVIAGNDQRMVQASVRFYAHKGYLAFGASTKDELLSVVVKHSPQVVLLSTKTWADTVASMIDAIRSIDADCNVILFAREEESELIKDAWRSGAFYFLREGATPYDILPEIERAFEDYFGRVQIRHLRKLVFVVMPFSSTFDDAYELGIKTAVAACGLVCERVDEQHFTEPIMERVFESMRRARFVVADISGSNPNVFFEVGFAYALEKPIIFLSSDPTEAIPFDLQHHPHIMYEGRIELLRAKLEQRLAGLVRDRVGLRRGKGSGAG